MEDRPCRMRVLAGVGVWGTGRVVTHIGLGWMGGLVLRMVLAFNVAELGRTSGGNKQSDQDPIRTSFMSTSSGEEARNRPAACGGSPLRTAGTCGANAAGVCGGGTAVVATVISMEPSGGDSTSPYM